MLVAPTKMTVAEALRSWLAGATELSAKTAERYSQLAELQIVPFLGARPLQKLRPVDVQEWITTLGKSGRKDGGPLAPRTVRSAFRVLHLALGRAARLEMVQRNVAAGLKLPRAEDKEVAILAAGQMALVLEKLAGHTLYPIVQLALSSGMRRGEMLALRWSDLDMEGATIRVERTLEETKTGLRFKAPKTRYSRREISLPADVIEVLRVHWKAQAERRLAVGLGRQEADALIFSKVDGEPMSPDNLSRDWRMAVKSLGLPKVMFHALRHTHASALIAAGIDVVKVSRRLGHGSPMITLMVYSHLFDRSDTAAADAIHAAMRTTKER